MSRADLGCDLGESFGTYTIGHNEEVIAYISPANVRYGFHAGNPCVVDHMVYLTEEEGVSIRAHPGFPDPVGLGRHNMNITSAEVKACTKYQIGALDALCVSSRVPLAHIKPHDALYNMTVKDMKLVMALMEAVYRVDPKLIFLGLSDSKMLEAAQQVGLTCASEAFADRVYNVDDSLVARGAPDTVIHNVDECARRIIGTAKDNVVTAITSEQISLKSQSICVHGDNAEAVEFVKHIRESLTREGIEIADLQAYIE